MSNTNQETLPDVDAGGVPGDVVGGIVLALLGLAHLFVLQVTGLVGTALLFVVWPLVGGAVGATVAGSSDGGRTLGLTGAIAGVFGAIFTVLVTLVAGIAGFWSDFIHTAFGTELAPVVIAMTMVFVITWTIFGYVGGHAVRIGVDRA